MKILFVRVCKNEEEDFGRITSQGDHKTNNPHSTRPTLICQPAYPTGGAKRGPLS